MSALNPQQFGSHASGSGSSSTGNGQGTTRSSGGTTTTVTVKGSAPSINTRSS